MVITELPSGLRKVCTTAWATVQDYRTSLRDRMRLTRVFKAAVHFVLNGLSLLFGAQALKLLLHPVMARTSLFSILFFV
jgi:hypothetical protein